MVAIFDNAEADADSVVVVDMWIVEFSIWHPLGFVEPVSRLKITAPSGSGKGLKDPLLKFSHFCEVELNAPQQKGGLSPVLYINADPAGVTVNIFC